MPRRTKQLHIEFSMDPLWGHIAAIRSSIESYMRIIHKNKHYAHQVSFAASELLENAVKYSTGDSIYFIMKYFDDGIVEILVQNDSNPKNIVDLKNEITTLNKVIPDRSYEKKILSSEKKYGLGLAMIRDKTQGKFFLNLKANRVRVRCKINLEP